ncbi:MAG TPA: hypothetical protein PK208_11615 [Fibrobacteria bacterium]|nr:hypothetical protein [Fibrobacteria bacterium]
MNISNQGIASNLLYGILLCTASSQAIPLHNGNSWKWEVTDYGARTSDTVEASIVDSAATDSGTIWTILRKDTLDHLQILQTKEGIQGWLHGNGSLPWEPAPYDSLRPSQFEPWGIQAWRSSIVEWDYFTGTSSWLSMSSVFGYRFTVTAPSCIWSDTLGVERFRFRNHDWRLISFNGIPTNIAKDSLFIPDSGSAFEWDYNHQSNSISRSNYSYAPVRTVDSSFRSDSLHLRWEILSNARDSAEWSIVRMRARKTSKFGTSDSTYDLYLNRWTKERRPSSSLAGESPDAAWWKDWTESVNDQEARRAHSERSTTVNPLDAKSFSSSMMSILPRNRVLASYTTNYESSQQYYSKSDLITYTLVSAESPLILATRKQNGRNNIQELSDLIKKYPDLEIRWMDCQGKTGSVRARALDKTESRTRMAPIYLFATLPNGTRWTGATTGFVRN